MPQKSANNTPPLKLFNTMAQEKQVFSPLNDETVRMYNCGPTVYDFQHIGNLRAYVFVDTLRRTLELNGYDVEQVINITDVGHLVSDGDTGQDKMTKGLKRENLPVTLEGMKKLGQKYAEVFINDLQSLNITQPEHFPRASNHIDEDIAMVEILAEKEYAYETDDGLYFDTTKLDDYGKLAGGLDSDDIQARIKNEQKKNPRDFALWKFDNKLGWSSPWGQGFPGWHIECSVMSQKYLGDSFDIHTGGIDHIRVHHTNEIAQSEAATGEMMANFWLHNDFMDIAEEKISKSIGNTIYLRDITKRGFSALSYRYLLLGAKYRTKMNFSWESIEAAETALNKLYDFMRKTDSGDVENEYRNAFTQAINDDLNTPKALAITWDLLGDSAISDENKHATLLYFDQVLGLQLANPPQITIPDEVKKLAQKRNEARKEKDYDTADTIRKEIEERGFRVEDSQNGQRILPK